jgi:hypothetical protein
MPLSRLKSDWLATKKTEKRSIENYGEYTMDYKFVKKIDGKIGIKALDDALQLVKDYVEVDHLYEVEMQFFGMSFKEYYWRIKATVKDLSRSDRNDDDNPSNEYNAPPFINIENTSGYYLTKIGTQGFRGTVSYMKKCVNSYDSDRSWRDFSTSSGLPQGNYMEYDSFAKHASVINMLTALHLNGFPEAREALKIAIFDGINRLFQLQTGSIELAGEEQTVKEILKTLNIADNRLVNRHVLLYGEPGCGKSEITKAVIQKTPDWLHYPLDNNIEDWTEFMTSLDKLMKFLGRKVMIVADEIDEIGLNRDKDRQKVFQLLRVLDGVGDMGHIKFVATTNRPNDLDPALLRVGRFGPARKIGKPSQDKALKIVGFYADRYKDNTEGKIDAAAIVAAHPGASGADIRAAFEECIIQEVKITDKKVIENLRFVMESKKLAEKDYLV